MARYVYRIDTAALVSWCPNDTDKVAPADELAAKGLALKDGLPPLDDTHAWDPATQTVVVIPSSLPRMVKNYDFVQAFTADEFLNISNSQSAQIKQLFYILGLAPDLDMNRPDIQGGIQLLVGLGLLTQDRAAAVAALGS